MRAMMLRGRSVTVGGGCGGGHTVGDHPGLYLWQTSTYEYELELSGGKLS